MSEEQSSRNGKISAVPGLAILGCFATGIAALVHAFSAGSPLGLFAAAGAFGIVVYVCFGD